MASQSSPPPDPGHADTLRPSDERLNAESSSHGPEGLMASQEEMLSHNGSKNERTNAKPAESPAEDGQHHGDDGVFEAYEPKPPKVLMNNRDDTPLELRSQIQIYATTEYAVVHLISALAHIQRIQTAYPSAGISSLARVSRELMSTVYPCRRWRSAPR